MSVKVWERQAVRERPTRAGDVALLPFAPARWRRMEIRVSHLPSTKPWQRFASPSPSPASWVSTWTFARGETDALHLSRLTRVATDPSGPGPDGEGPKAYTHTPNYRFSRKKRKASHEYFLYGFYIYMTIFWKFRVKYSVFVKSSHLVPFTFLCDS